MGLLHKEVARVLVGLHAGVDELFRDGTDDFVNDLVVLCHQLLLGGVPVSAGPTLVLVLENKKRN